MLPSVKEPALSPAEGRAIRPVAETEAPPDPTHRVPTSDDLEVSTYLEIARQREGEQPREGAPPAPAQPETIIVLDFGSQYSMLIARRVRECHVYCELVPFDAPWEDVQKLNPRGFILSGGPASVYDDGGTLAPTHVFGSCPPLAHQPGGRLAPSPRRESGHPVIHQEPDAAIFAGLPRSMPVWMSHGDQVVALPPGFRSLAYSDSSPIAVMGNDAGVIGLQFPPEGVHTHQRQALVE